MKGNSIPENLWKPNHFVAMLPLEQVPQETAEYSQGLWCSPASSITKTGRHDITKILLNVA
jgi:hypothetical protein